MAAFESCCCGRSSVWSFISVDDQVPLDQRYRFGTINFLHRVILQFGFSSVCGAAGLIANHLCVQRWRPIFPQSAAMTSTCVGTLAT